MVASVFLTRSSTDPAYTFGALLGLVAIAGLFTIWRASTRPYLPIVGALIGLVTAGTDMARERDEREQARQSFDEVRSSVELLLEGGSPGSLSSPSEPPADRAARMVWAVNQIFATLPQLVDSIGRFHGVDLENPPDALGTARYLANAGSHPEVEQYWIRMAAVSEDIQEHLPALISAKARDIALRADLPPTFMGGVETGLARSQESTVATWALNKEMTQLGLEAHRYLVRVDSRVDYDAEADIARFRRDGELNEANRLLLRFEEAAARLEAQHHEQGRQMMRFVDSCASSKL
jgi:hypothetical protein